MAGGASFCRRRRLADSGKRVGDGRGAGEGGFCFATSLGVRERGGCRRGCPDDAGVGDLPARDSPGPRVRMRRPFLAFPSPSLSRGFVEPSGPERGRDTAAPFPCAQPLRKPHTSRSEAGGRPRGPHPLPATLPRPLSAVGALAARDRAISVRGPGPRRWAGAGRRQRLEETRETRRPLYACPRETCAAPPPHFLLPGASFAGATPGTAGVQAPSGPGSGRAGASPAVPSVANRLHRSPRPRAGSGRGWSGSACVCAPWRRLRPPPARSRLPAAAGRPLRVSARPPLLLLLHFASASL